MKNYLCHCMVTMYDDGFKDEVICRPTLTVKAKDETEAKNNAEGKFVQEQLGDRQLILFVVNVIKEIDSEIHEIKSIEDIKTQLESITESMIDRTNEISNSMYSDTPSRSDIIAGDSNLMTSWRLLLRQVIKKLEE